jgi:hypothetical protein
MDAPAALTADLPGAFEPSGPQAPAIAQAAAIPIELPGAEPVTAVARDLAAASAAAPGMATGDLDALAGRLYDKIRYRLKAELRLDRERAGLITDRR